MAEQLASVSWGLAYADARNTICKKQMPLFLNHVKVNQEYFKKSTFLFESMIQWLKGKISWFVAQTEKTKSS